MKPNDKVVFYWLSKQGKRCSLTTTGYYYKTYAIELLEDFFIDKIQNPSYSVNNEPEIMLDYFNTKL